MNEATKKFIVSFSKKGTKMQTKAIWAFDYECARKQGAYWFGVLPNDSRLTVDRRD